MIYKESRDRFLEQETKQLQNQKVKPYRRIQLQVRGRMLNPCPEA